MQLLPNKVAIVTGGSSGMGRSAAQIFSREGAKVVVADLNVKGGEETVQMIKDAGGDAIFMKTDVSKASDVEAMVNKTIATYGKLDCAFNNAGIGMHRPIIDCTEEEWNHIIDVDLKSVFLCMKYEIIQMLKTGGGSIVNTSSMVAVVGTANLSGYAAAKYGVVGLTKSVALEYVKAGIRVNAVGPHLVKSPEIDRCAREEPAWLAQELGLTPIGRLSDPPEVGESVVWLCSDKASFITGQLLIIDGGYTIH
jgi:NAD(P)-dependent dehydrogenase (short-subunit alcohol dehydrogenase family)